MWLFSVLLLLLTGTMFVTSPAALIARLTPMENDAQLWVATAYLLKQGLTWFSSLVTALPATFMSVISLTYILMASEGYGLSLTVAYPVGVIFAAFFGAYLYIRVNKAGILL